MIPRIERVNAGCSVVKIAFAFSVNKRTVRIVDAAIICGFASSCLFGYAVGNVACRHIADGAEHCTRSYCCIDVKLACAPVCFNPYVRRIDIFVTLRRISGD